MDASVGGSAASMRVIGKTKLLAGASCAALVVAVMAPRQAMGGNYVANSDGSLRAAIAAANSDPDPNATITLTASFAVLSASLPTSTKPLTIDTQGFTLFGAPGAGVAIGPGAVRTLVGTFMGSNGGSSAAGLLLRNGAAVTNFGLVQGGTAASGIRGRGRRFRRPRCSHNLDQSWDDPRRTRGKRQRRRRRLRSKCRRPGSSTPGTIEGGGPGGGAITANAAAASIDVVNSGTIRAGTGANAIGWLSSVTPTTGVIRLELQDGSQIFGNVVANATAITDRLRLSGTGFSILDGSVIGDAGQYRNFNIFEKTGTSTWALTGTRHGHHELEYPGRHPADSAMAAPAAASSVTSPPAGTLAFNRSDTLSYNSLVLGHWRDQPDRHRHDDHDRRQFGLRRQRPRSRRARYR